LAGVVDIVVDIDCVLVIVVDFDFAIVLGSMRHALSMSGASLRLSRLVARTTASGQPLICHNAPKSLAGIQDAQRWYGRVEFGGHSYDIVRGHVVLEEAERMQAVLDTARQASFGNLDLDFSWRPLGF